MSSKREIIKKLKSERKQIESQLNRFSEFVSNCSTSTNKLSISERYKKCENLWDSFNSVQLELEFNEESEDQERQVFEDIYFETVCKFKDLLKEPAQSSTTEVSNQVLNSNFVKLPPLDLPTFKGNYDGWLGFVDTFTALIHSNNSLSDVQKFYYLKSCLKGDAARVIHSIEVTDINYEIAFKLLRERYENKKVIIQSHIKCLFDLQIVGKNILDDLRSLSDNIQKNLRALKTLKEPVESWDTLLLYMFSNKLDLNSKREWEGLCVKKEKVSCDEFLIFLAERCQILENLEAHKVSQNKQVNQNVNNQIHQGSGDFSRMKSKKSSHGLVVSHSEEDNSLPSSQYSNCLICKESKHYIYQCPKFLALSETQRLNEIKKLHLCLNCFRTNHLSTRCALKGCRKCGKPHNTLLHINFNQPRLENSFSPTETSNESSGGTVVTHTSSNSEGEVLLSTAIVLVVDSEGNEHKARALLDSGSQSNFVCNQFVSKMKVKCSDVKLSVVGINASVTQSNKIVNLNIKSCFSEFLVNLDFYVLDKITNNLPNFPINKEMLKLPSNINLADSDFHVPAKIDILLGGGIFYELLLHGQIRMAKNMPLLQKTRLGWIITGSLYQEQNNKNSSQSYSNQSICNLSRIDNINQQIEQFWKIEELEIKPLFKKEERECEELYIQTTTHHEDGKFIVRLPTKEGIENIGNSRQIAENRFLKLERKLRTNENLRIEYTRFMKEYEDLGHMTKILTSEIETSTLTYYMPHHGVIKEDSTTTKLRVVFDASAKTDRGISLNEKLKSGPTIQDDLFSILLRWRQHEIVLGADAEKMYRQVWISEDQRDLQRIVWRPSSDKPINHYRLNTVTYGTTSASFLAIRSLQRAAEEQEELYPVACAEIKKNFYVDDLLTGGATPAEVLKLKNEITTVLSKSGFNLRKWVSNSQEVMRFLETDSQITQYLVDKEVTKTLGLMWNIQEDTLQYVIQLDRSRMSTKRNILSTISKIFDPLGLVSPIVVRAKMLMQKLWIERINWDEKVSPELHNLWRQFCDDLPLLNNLRIERRAMICQAIEIEIHGYCDASERAYGACLYARCSLGNGLYKTSILCSKSRVAPIKTLTLPRLELCGALLLSRLVKEVVTALSVKISKIHCWTDSKIVLSWLASEPSRWNVFVAHRVAEIQHNVHIDCWRHVTSSNNPADLISRGCNVNHLIQCELWWQGPSVLKEEILFNIDIDEFKVDYTNIPEQRNTRQCFQLVVDKSIFSRFSNFLKLQRVVAYCFRFATNVKVPNKNRLLSKELTIDELNHSLIALCKVAQSIDFSNEILALSSAKPIPRNSKLYTLNPMLDKSGVLRISGRISKAQIYYDQSHPIILNRDNFLTTLIIEYEHRKNLHMGAQSLLYNIRTKFWILGGINTVKKVLRKCIICFRVKPKFSSTLMGELPEHRVIPTKAFYNSGVDYAGPFYIKSSNLRRAKITKAYLCVFICMVTRAVHLEVVTDLSTECFLNALKRFIARRGKCKTIFSDCGSNFIGASNERREFSNFLCSEKLKNEVNASLSQDNISWKFIPPRSPHFGGLWESCVKQAKYHLRRVVGNSNLTFEELTTVFTQIEACINSRPLSSLSNDPEDFMPLTPGHFLVGESLVALPERDVQNIKCGRLSRYQHLTQMVQTFWSRWNKECLSELINRSKWHRSTGPVVKIGDLVVLKDENLPPLKWSLGRVKEVFPGSDGVIRVALIKTQQGEFKRAVAKLAVLPMDNDS